MAGTQNLKPFNHRSGAEAGRASGLSRRRNRFDKYLQLAEKMPLRTVLQLLARVYYQAGYQAAERKNRGESRSPKALQR